MAATGLFVIVMRLPMAATGLLVIVMHRRMLGTEKEGKQTRTSSTALCLNGRSPL